MKMEMTERDKKLLIFLAVFVIVVGFSYWGIRPLLARMSELDNEIEEQEEERQLNETKISMLPMLMADNEKLEEGMGEVRKNFYPLTTADEIDRTFTGMALDYMLEIYSMDIDVSTKEVESLPYKYSGRYELKMRDKKKKKGSSSSSTKTSKAAAEEAEAALESENSSPEDLYDRDVRAASGIFVTTVTLKLQGSEDNLRRLVDDLSVDTKNHLVRSYKWSQGTNLKQDEKGEFKVEPQVFLDLVLDIYECEE